MVDPSVTFLGAGNYASRTLIPAFSKTGVNLETCVSMGGVSAKYSGKKFGFARASTNASSAIHDQGSNCIVIATRHDLHSTQVLSALKAGKHVFCEKPLCLTIDELNKIEEVAKLHPGQILMVGFNRRFSPLITKAKKMLATESATKNL